jgi:4-amino-4-deoxy-L-arabinose transferase-like glycosyltransferase
MSRSSPNRLDLAIVVAVAFIANFVYLFFSSGDFYFPDSFTYLAPAKSLLAGSGFLSPLGNPDTIRTPGYPLLLALFGARTFPVIVLQHLANVAIAVALYLFVLARCGSRLMAIVASIVFAIDVPTIHNANKILSETLFTVLLYAIFVLALQRRHLLVAGLLLGALVLVRPIAMFYFIPLAIILAIWRTSMRQLAIVVAIAIALPAAWAVRNRMSAGVFTVSSIGNMNLLSHRAAGALAIEDGGDDFKKDLVDEQNGLQEDADDIVAKAMNVEDAQEVPVAVRARYYGSYALHVIAQHPRAFVELTIRGLLVNLFDSDWDAVAVETTISPEIVMLVLTAVPVIVFVFAAVGAIDLWRRDGALAVLIVVTVVYFIGISAGSEAEARFRVPVAPQLAIAAAAGVEAVRRGMTPAVNSPAASNR